MRSYLMRIEIQENEIEQILEELTMAQETIYKCYNRLKDAGVLTVRKEQTTSGN